MLNPKLNRHDAPANTTTTNKQAAKKTAPMIAKKLSRKQIRVSRILFGRKHLSARAILEDQYITTFHFYTPPSITSHEINKAIAVINADHGIVRGTKIIPAAKRNPTLGTTKSRTRNTRIIVVANMNENANSTTRIIMAMQINEIKEINHNLSPLLFRPRDHPPNTRTLYHILLQ